VDNGVGVELAFVGAEEPDLLLAQLDDLGFSAAAVRGVDPLDELLGGLFIADPLVDNLEEDVPMRVSLDGFLVRGIARGLGGRRAEVLLKAARRAGPVRALTVALELLSTLGPAERTRVEGLTHAEISAAIDALGADETATDLLESLAAEIQHDLSANEA
jgi:hypothetical protein